MGPHPMKVFIIAGEVSGDRLAGALMGGLRTLVPEVTFEGVGGDQMRAQGLRSLFPMDELSLMGIVEILPKYFHLKARIRQTAEAVVAAAPDVLITVDSPDFCLRVARLVKAVQSVKAVHYVAPTVWAWRPGRAAKMATVIDHVLALFPFEPPYMQAAGMTCDFVGHPVVAEPVATETQAADFRAATGIGDAPLILALPGSRRGEVTRLAAPFGAALARVLAARPEARIVIPCAAPVAGLVRDLTAQWPGAPVLIDPAQDPEGHQKRAAFRAADVALAASGTVSLELAANRTPMVIAYDMNWITRKIAQRMLTIDVATLVSLVSDTRVIPEFIGERCQPGPIADAVVRVMDAPDAQDAAMAIAMERLGQGGEPPGMRAARSVLVALGRSLPR